jgi:Ribbon-helix-helix protein, copG family
MFRHMRTTVRLDDKLLEEAKEEAARQGKTLTAFMDEAIRRALIQSKPKPSRKKIRLPVSKSTGGTLPGVDLNDTASLLDIMEGVD